MNETQEQILYFRNLEKTYAERLKQSTNERFNELTIISRDMFKAGKEALQEKAGKDKIRCENCNWFEKEKYFLDDEIPMNEQTYYTCAFYGDDVPEGIPVEINHFCNHFEPKENENG